jgi:ribosomal protein S18 acetylase RimI-like enzyme
VELRLRPAGLPDLAEILTWIPDAPALERWAGPGKTFPTRPELLWQEIKATHENAFALAQGDRLLGFGQLLLRPGGASFHLARIIISPSYRGRGFGALLCRQLMAAARRDRAVKSFSLNVHPQNEAAINLYHSLGFRPVAHQPRRESIFMIKKVTVP